MSLTNEKKEEWEKNLKEAELMKDTDSIQEHTLGDYWELFVGKTRGNFFFTNEKFIFVGGLLGANNFSINYTDIKDLKCSFVGPFIPTGITVTAFNPEKGKNKKYKCSVLKRKQWITYLAEKARITL